MSERTDVAIVGGGIAGTALAAVLVRHGLTVTLLERQESFEDLCRGEWLAPWGVRETHLLGLADTFVAAGAWEIREWMPWDEVVDPEEAQPIDMSSLIPGIGGPLSFRHNLVCAQLARQAQDGGAHIVMGAKKAHVQAGSEPTVRYLLDGVEHELHARLVFGACGRAGVIGRQVGITMRSHYHHWGAGMPVTGLQGWPSDVQAMGTEGDVMFMVFPQGFGRARLYLNFATEDKHRYRGPNAVRNFLDAFDLKCLPNSRSIVEAQPDGPMVAWPSVATMPEVDPLAPGVVLIGDEAGMNDSILGTGLSSALRDARIVSGLITATDDWGPRTFEPFLRERAVRMSRLRFGADVMCRLQAEFGPIAAERRRRARQMMNDNPAMQVISLLSMVPHEQIPEFGFNEFFAERLLAA
jgi:menaquinone-9 beta-reductase